MNELNSSKEELKKWESKFWLFNKLNELSWDKCGNDVQGWLRLSDGLTGLEVKAGKDGSVYFQLGEMKARLKDLHNDIQLRVKARLINTVKAKSSIRY